MALLPAVILLALAWRWMARSDDPQQAELRRVASERPFSAAVALLFSAPDNLLIRTTLKIVRFLIILSVGLVGGLLWLAVRQSGVN